jgi:phosphoglycolate phosphatase
MTGFDVLDGATIVFDLDGTLVDSAPDLIGTLNVLLGQEGIAPLPLDQARPYIGQGARRMIERGFAAQGLDLPQAQLDALFARFLDHYQAHSADLTRPFPGVAEALNTLKGAGAKLAVCTNKLTRLSTPILEALDLSRFFDAVVGPDMAPAPKPDGRHVARAVELAGGEIGRSVMVGDSAADAGSARAAGAALVLVDFGYTDIPASDLGADILISGFDQLVEGCVRLLGDR